MEKFDYNTKWGTTYRGCYFTTGNYSNNGNKYLGIVSDEEGEIITCSVNAQRVNESDVIGIKDYSENEGMVKFLKDVDMIEGEPVAVERSGFVVIPYFNLTKKAMKIFESQEKI